MIEEVESMSNTSKGRGIKGSKYWMQLIPNTVIKTEFDRMIGEKLRWLSPLVANDYMEYELSHSFICQQLGITDREKAFSFWPRRQPQWDGIAVGEDSGTLYLVEAKAHLREMESRCRASLESKDKIIKAMREVFSGYAKANDFNIWMERYYQLGNRLTFLEYMKKMNLPRYPHVKLLLINFTDDMTYLPTTEEDWKRHYEKVFEEMTGEKKIPSDVRCIYLSVKDWAGVIL